MGSVGGRGSRENVREQVSWSLRLPLAALGGVLLSLRPSFCRCVFVCVCVCVSLSGAIPLKLLQLPLLPPACACALSWTSKKSEHKEEAIEAARAWMSCRRPACPPSSFLDPGQPKSGRLGGREKHRGVWPPCVALWMIRRAAAIPPTVYGCCSPPLCVFRPLTRLSAAASTHHRIAHAFPSPLPLLEAPLHRPAISSVGACRRACVSSNYELQPLPRF